MGNKKQWEFPVIWKSELELLGGRLNKSIEWVEENRNEIHPSISFIQAVELYDMGIDVTQLKKLLH